MEPCLTAWAECGFSHQPPSQVIPTYLQSAQSASGVQVQNVVTPEADGNWSLLSAALQCKVLTMSPVVPLYSKNITTKKQTQNQKPLWFTSSKQLSTWCFHLWSESPGTQRPKWIFSALPLHASNIFYSWCKYHGEDFNCRLTSVCSWCTGSIALVKAIRKQHSKPQNVGSRHKMCFPIQDRTLPVLSWGNRP